MEHWWSQNRKIKEIINNNTGISCDIILIQKPFILNIFFFIISGKNSRHLIENAKRYSKEYLNEFEYTKIDSK